MGIDWWEHDGFLSGGRRGSLEQRLRTLDEKAGLPVDEERSAE